jgi:CPA1 family monovalent cation:H+ antiporter
VVAEYEHRLASLGAAGETRTHARRRRAAEKRFRSSALGAERAAVDDLWRCNIIADEVHRPLQQLLDFEESMLRSILDPEA